MNFQDLLKELDALNFPAEKYAITSSGPLAVRGIRPARDIDLVVIDDFWLELGQKYPIKKMEFCDSISIGNVEILGNFRVKNLYSPKEQIAKADLIDGRRYVNLEMVMAFKKALGRDKDKRDLELINNYLLKKSIETEIKLPIARSSIEDIVAKIEKEFNCKKNEPLHQITHQFFFEDYSQQNVFPRIRNEEDGRVTLTVKVKLGDKSDFFKRIELETNITDAESVIQMMPFFGFPRKISWEKKRHSFSMSDVSCRLCFFLDETPMDWFLEIEAAEGKIEEAIIRLELQDVKRINKAYLGLWEEYKKENGISGEDMLFKKDFKSN